MLEDRKILYFASKSSFNAGEHPVGYVDLRGATVTATTGSTHNSSSSSSSSSGGGLLQKSMYTFAVQEAAIAEVSASAILYTSR